MADVHSLRRRTDRSTGRRRRALRALGGAETVIGAVASRDQSSDQKLETLIKAQAYGLGFDLVGITTLGPAETAAAFDEWIAHGYAGEMSYLPRNAEKRRDSRLPFDGASTAIVVAMNYGGTEPPGPVARLPGGGGPHAL